MSHISGWESRLSCQAWQYIWASNMARYQFCDRGVDCTMFNLIEGKMTLFLANALGDDSFCGWWIDYALLPASSDSFYFSMSYSIF